MFDINSPILTKSGLSAGQLQAAEHAMRPDNGYHDDFWQALVDAENQYDLNALFILAHADVESAHGTSNYAVSRNNLFGFNAVDSDPDLASTYSSQAVSVHDYADFLSKYYLYEHQTYWGGAATPHGIFVHYSSSHDAEANSVVNIMNTLAGHVTSVPAPNFTPTSVSIPMGDNSYIVKSGDNMSTIAADHHMSLAQLEAQNPQAGHPAGNFGIIWPGDKLSITNPQSSVVLPRYVTVVSGDNLTAIADRVGISLAQIKALNPNAGHPAANFNNIWPGDQIRVK